MSLTANRQQYVDNARGLITDYDNRMQQQERTDDDFTFAEMRDYVPSDAERVQMERLATIQREANETVFDSRVRF